MASGSLMIYFTHIMLSHSHIVKLQYDKNYALFKLRVPIDYAQVRMCHHSGGIWHDRRRHWTSILLTVINEIMIYSTSSSAIHTGMVCATGFPVIRTRTLGHWYAACRFYDREMSHRHQLPWLAAETEVAGQETGMQARGGATQAHWTGVPRSAEVHWGWSVDISCIKIRIWASW